MTYKPSFLKSPEPSRVAENILTTLYQPIAKSLAAIGALLTSLLVPLATALVLAVPLAAMFAPKESFISFFWASAGILFIVGLIGLLIGWLGSYDSPF